MPPKRRRHDATDSAVASTSSRKRVTRSKSETRARQPGSVGRHPPADTGPASLNPTSTDASTTDAAAAAVIADDGAARPRRYWLMKAEPESRVEKGKDVKFSIDDLAACTEPAGWDGVRNYGARNNMQAMRKGDLAFFYHSNCKEPGIVGIMEIVQEASVDESAFDPAEPYYDPKSEREKPKWYLVHVSYRRKLSRPIGLAELKSHAGGKLSQMPLLKQSRLSVSEVPEDCWDFILSLEAAGGP